MGETKKSTGSSEKVIMADEKNHTDSLKAILAVDDLVDEDAIFDYLLREVGMKGRFQTIFNLSFNLVFSVLIAMPYLNIVLALSVPDHWCYVPGREETNFTIAEWKELTIPRDPESRDGFCKCKMYNISGPVDPAFLNNHSERTQQEVGCQYGWEYDRTWYTLTAPSQEDWVCDKSIYVSNTFALNRAGDVVGSFIFGQLGDVIGRRPVFFITLTILVLGRSLSALTAHIYWVFLIVSFLGSASTSASFQSPLAIGIEVSAHDKQAYLAMLQCLGWTLGICIMPLTAWASGNWVIFMLVTTLPAGLFLFVRKHFPESPRWLASCGKIEQCQKVLSYIAEINGTSLPPDTKDILKKIAGRKEKFYGIASLFTSWRLGKNVVLICGSWVISSLSYYTLMLNISYLSGNPFLNFFYQSLVELPAYLVGKALSDRYGRRWTQVGIFLTLTVGYIVLISIIKDPNMSWLATLLVVFAKFCITATFYIIYLQSMEIYPTCVRQTGTSLASVVGSGAGIIGPYIIYLGVSKNVLYPSIILASLALIGAVCCAFLPETLNQQLPETLADAQKFGYDQKFWEINYNKKKNVANVIL
ncbi:organic cation/carnitine transporter 2 [Anabrus simplex]|uniref:organic cation/carnitine transporter 2 n=1 Tax=Anabrus simplex TaxID=316456 RepID=UPI0035A3210F